MLYLASHSGRAISSSDWHFVAMASRRLRLRHGPRTVRRQAVHYQVRVNMATRHVLYGCRAIFDVTEDTLTFTLLLLGTAGDSSGHAVSGPWCTVAPCSIRDTMLVTTPRVVACINAAPDRCRLKAGGAPWLGVWLTATPTLPCVSPFQVPLSSGWAS